MELSTRIAQCNCGTMEIFPNGDCLIDMKCYNSVTIHLLGLWGIYEQQREKNCIVLAFLGLGTDCCLHV